MIQEHSNSISAGNCIDSDSRHYANPRMSIANGQMMLSYDRHGNCGQHHISSLTETATNSSFTYEPDFAALQFGGAAIPQNQQQFAYHPQYELYHSFPSLPCLNRSRPSLQLNPFTGTIEPQMIFKQEHLSSHLAPQAHFADFRTSTSPELSSASTNSPSSSFGFHGDQYRQPSMWQQDLPSFQLPDGEQSTVSCDDGFDGQDEEEEEIYDKPYAQLIYEALLRAPGHRMLLRDIYDWFIQNTRKPRESGTNGWQNSIRHNLSMNQAFENDKNDPAANRGARKANSMWVLTERAIKHGVQSTTRYRKNGTSKKGTSNRIPAVQRQRSGAKGGRAARRAARLKRQGQGKREPHQAALELDSPLPYNLAISPLSTTQDQWSSYSHSPTTPTEDQFFSSAYSLPPAHRSYYEFEPDLETNYDAEPYIEEEEQIRQMLSASNSILEDIARCKKQSS